jgi:hypothetical protein
MTGETALFVIFTHCIPEALKKMSCARARGVYAELVMMMLEGKKCIRKKNV